MCQCSRLYSGRLYIKIEEISIYNIKLNNYSFSTIFIDAIQNFLVLTNSYRADRMFRTIP
jgi:hypothetical protein